MITGIGLKGISQSYRLNFAASFVSGSVAKKGSIAKFWTISWGHVGSVPDFRIGSCES